MMEYLDKIYLLIQKKNVILSSGVLLKKSDLLHDLVAFTTPDSIPIPIPHFITEQMVSDIVKILETNNSASLITQSNLDYIIQILKALDFLAINEMFKNLLIHTMDEINIGNCFQVFKLTNSSICCEKLTAKSLSLIMSQINQYYESDRISENVHDPYIENYATLEIFELCMMLTHDVNNSTITRIMVLQHWWNRNKMKAIKDKEEIFNILQYINENASYIPRSKIQYMRAIRDHIIIEINTIENNQDCMPKEIKSV